MINYLESQYDINAPALVSVLDELPLWSAPFGLTLLNNIQYRPNIKILDIGCGTGFPLIELAMRFGDSCQVFGIDIWEEAGYRIEQKIKEYQLNNVGFICNSIDKNSFDDNYFDLIVSNNGITNVDNIVLAIKESYRIAKKDAQFIFTYNLIDTMQEFYSCFMQCLEEMGKDEEILKLELHKKKQRKPINEMLDILTKEGFVVKNQIQDSFSIKFVDGSSMLRHHFIRFAFLDKWKSILKEEDLYSVFNSIELLLNKQSLKDGGLTLTIPYICIDCRK